MGRNPEEPEYAPSPALSQEGVKDLTAVTSTFADRDKTEVGSCLGCGEVAEQRFRENLQRLKALYLQVAIRSASKLSDSASF